MNRLTCPVAIQGLGCVGGFGCGIDDFCHALVAGSCAPTLSSEQHADGLAYGPAYLAQTDTLTDFVAKRSLRRLDHYARMALLGGCLALEDAGIAGEQREKVGVMVASGYGASTTTFSFLDSVLDDGDHCASPTNFSNSVHNVAAAYLSMQLGMLGPNLTISQFEMSMSSALCNAVCWLQQGRVDTVLVGGVDEHCPVLNYCYQRYFSTVDGGQTSAKIEPFVFDRQTAIPGEGAGFLVLSADPDKARYGMIDGVDVGHMRQPTWSADDLLLVGADGHCNCGQWYESIADHHQNHRLASCTPVYGSQPTGQAFDLIAAALMINDQRLYGHTTGHTTMADSDTIDSVTSLKVAADGQYGAVHMVKGI